MQQKEPYSAVIRNCAIASEGSNEQLSKVVSYLDVRLKDDIQRVLNSLRVVEDNKIVADNALSHFCAWR